MVNELDDSDPTHAICVDSLSKSFGSGEDRVIAVNDISFRVDSGDIVGLLGPNGAGKTTTIKSMLGIVTPDAGAVEIDGVDVYSNPKAAYKNMEAMMEGARNHYWRLTVRENLEYFASIAGENPAAIRDQHDDLLEIFDLREFENEQVRNLSRGMKQKVAIASTLGRNVNVVFLDEPTLGLDIESSLKLRQSLRDLATERELTVVLSSHDMDVIADICDRVIIMKDGGIIADDRVEALLNTFESSEYRITVQDINASSIKSDGLINGLNDVTEIEDCIQLEITGDIKTFYQVIEELEARDAKLIDIESKSVDLEDVFMKITKGGD